ncbi:MAG: PQQ-binding-like beta-propeller repeat protein [Ktedonobacteraceae bacterium]
MMMKQKILILCSLPVLLAGVLGAFVLMQHAPAQVQAVGNTTNWTMFQGHLGHDGFNGAETVLTPKTVPQMKAHWTHRAGGTISSQVVEANGLLYWGSWDGLEHATHATDGSDVWATNVGTTTPPPARTCNPPSAGPSGAAAIVPVPINGVMTSVAFVSGGNAVLYALEASTGKVLWSTRLGSSPDNMLWAGPVVYQGSVYVGVASYGDCPLTPGQLVQMNASTGSVQHSYTVVPTGCIGGGIWDTPTIDQATGMLYVSTGTYANSCSKAGNQAEGLLELRASDLTLVGFWQVPPSARIVDSDFGSTPTLFRATIAGVVHQMVGLVNKNGIYYAFDRSHISAGPLWQVRLSDRGNSFSSSGWDGSRLYAADATTTINGVSCPGSLRALDPANGNILWQDCLSAGVQSSIMAVPNLVAIGAGPYSLIVNALTGKQLFTFHDTSGGGARFVSTPTIVNGALYQGNSDGNLFAFGL